jgi:hypothetical protein
MSLDQTLFTIYTLYNTRRNKLGRYSYASFDLTVATCAFMSIANFAAHILCPNYPERYMSMSQDMIEFQEEHKEFIFFEGTIENSKPPLADPKGPRYQ